MHFSKIQLVLNTPYGLKCSETHKRVKQLPLVVRISQPGTCTVVTLWLAEWFAFMKLTTDNLELVSEGRGHRDTVFLRACESKIGFMNWGCSSVVSYVLSMCKDLDFIPGMETRPESLLPSPKNPVDFLGGNDCWVFPQICDRWGDKTPEPTSLLGQEVVFISFRVIELALCR